MISEGRDVAISEMVQIHIRQKPTPKSVTIKLDIIHRLGTYLLEPKHKSKLKHRARAMSLLGKREVTNSACLFKVYPGKLCESFTIISFRLNRLRIRDHLKIVVLFRCYSQALWAACNTRFSLKQAHRNACADIPHILKHVLPSYPKCRCSRSLQDVVHIRGTRGPSMRAHFDVKLCSHE